MTLVEVVGRRQVLARALGGGATLAFGAVLASACTGPPPEPPPPDPLIALRDSALADAALAEAVGATHAALAAAAAALAADRRAHAESLGAEVVRATPTVAELETTTTAAPVPAVPPGRAAASAALVEAMRAAQEQASALVGGLPRYRAGLVASVAACCASHQAVLA
jgi:hypothetical protein